METKLPSSYADCYFPTIEGEDVVPDPVFDSAEAVAAFASLAQPPGAIDGREEVWESFPLHR
jgi:hypothetical protein